MNLRRSKNRAAVRLRMGASGSVFANAATSATHPASDARVFASDPAELPGLSMPEPEDRTRVLVSAAVSAVLHSLVIGAIATLGYIAQQAVEEVIPVEILNGRIELRGAEDSPPLPVPKILPAPMAIALALQPSELAAVPAPMLEAPSLDLAELLGAPLSTLAEFQATPSAADLIAPRVEMASPSVTAVRTATRLPAPGAFERPSELNATRYKGAAVAPPMAVRASQSGLGRAATGISADDITAGSAGGDPNTVATTPCLESAYVQRYLDEIKHRTYARWELPLDAHPDDVVQFRIALDHSGSIAKLELIESTSPSFAASAMAAYRSAAPFPPLGDHNRCLSTKTFRLTFRNPELP